MNFRDNNSEEISSYTGILHACNLKRTNCREGIINVIMHSPHALSENEIKAQLTQKFDRTTFYRSFKTLLEKQLIHKIVLDDQVVKYAVNTGKCSVHLHAHFFCIKCGGLVCIDNEIVASVQLPPGFEATETEVIVRGTCSTCNL